MSWQQRVLGVILTLVLGLSGVAWADTEFGERPDVQAYIQTLVKKYGFSQTELTELFNGVTVNRKVIDTMNRPYEAKPWWKYRQLYITASRIDKGIKFWDMHQSALNQAAKHYGVPPEILVSIIGVESNYGDFTGKYPLIDTLSTFAFEYPRREAFFKQQLTELLLMQKESGIDISKLQGSYAGAIGLPQFMPSSFRAYAVDSNNNGQIDLWKEENDVIASVANYLSKNGWQRDQPVAIAATVNGKAYQSIPKASKPSLSAGQLAQYQITPKTALPNDVKANLIEFEGKLGPEFWLALPNFYSIRRYNPSNNYAMAVYQLADAIKTLRQTRSN